MNPEILTALICVLVYLACCLLAACLYALGYVRHSMRFISGVQWSFLLPGFVALGMAADVLTSSDQLAAAVVLVISAAGFLFGFYVLESSIKEDIAQQQPTTTAAG